MRNTIGATNPANAAPGTIRGDLASSMPDNLVHGSDSPESAEREIALWFSGDELALASTGNIAAWTKANADYTDASASGAWAARRSLGHLPRARVDGRLPRRRRRPRRRRARLRHRVRLGVAREARRAPGGRRSDACAARDGAPDDARDRDRVPARRRRRASRCRCRMRSFDLAISEYGACLWADPYLWVPEAARLLRPGGRLIFLTNSNVLMLTMPPVGKVTEQLQRPAVRAVRVRRGPARWASSSTCRTASGSVICARTASRSRRCTSCRRRPTRSSTSTTTTSTVDVGATVAVAKRFGSRARRDLPLVLASTSPQRRAILEQLGLPFDVVAPDYEELGDDPLEHAAGKARSVDGGDRPVLGVDTIVALRGARTRKARERGRGGVDARLPLREAARGRLRALPAHAGLGGAAHRDDASSPSAR